MQSERADELVHEWNLLGAPEAFSEQEQLLAAFFGASTVGLAILDDQLRYQAINNTLAAMNGVPAEAHLGRTLRDVLGDAASKLDPILQRVLVTAEPALNIDLTATLPAMSEVRHWIVNYFPIKNAAGRVKQVGAVVVDISKQRESSKTLSSLGGKLQEERDRLQALLEVSNTLVRSELDFRHLFPKISACIRRVMRHEFACLALLDKAAGCVRVYASESQVRDDFLSQGIEVPLKDSLATTVMAEREAKTFRYADLEAYVERSAIVKQAVEHGFRSICMVPLATGRCIIGTLSLGSKSESAFTIKDVDLLSQVGAEVSLALENAIAHQRLQVEKERLQTTMELNNVLMTDRDWQKLFPAISNFMQRIIPHEYASVAVYDDSAHLLSLYPLDSGLAAALHTRATPIPITEMLAAQVAIALDNARAYREIADLTDKLAKEKLYLEDEIRTELHFEEIVGESAPLKRVLAQAKTVAPSDATTLILGETGTGKELIARAIHRMSSRKDASFIKLNCAAIPTGLLESELFGHERGAFTGAISQKIGRLELADQGTLFLDEVGDIPLELQPKLLRVLQDHEFERLGSTRTLRVNIS